MIFTKLIFKPRTQDSRELDNWIDGVTRRVNSTAAAQADTTATDVAGLVTDFNDLLAKLRAARIIEQ